jgi:hypothetical protein
MRLILALLVVPEMKWKKRIAYLFRAEKGPFMVLACT